MNDIRIYLKYKGKQPTMVRKDRGGNKIRMAKGMVKDFSSDMAVFYTKQYGSMFEQVEKPSKKKSNFDYPKHGTRFAKPPVTT